MSTSSDPNVQGVPGDEGTTLTEVLAAYAAGGFDVNFGSTEDGRLRCGACSEAADPSTVVMASLRRLEGASDPDDMLALAALVCANCGTQGSLILNYGPAATPEDAGVLQQLEPPPPPPA